MHRFCYAVLLLCSSDCPGLASQSWTLPFPFFPVFLHCVVAVVQDWLSKAGRFPSPSFLSSVLRSPLSSNSLRLLSIGSDSPIRIGFVAPWSLCLAYLSIKNRHLLILVSQTFLLPAVLRLHCSIQNRFPALLQNLLLDVDWPQMDTLRSNSNSTHVLAQYYYPILLNM